MKNNSFKNNSHFNKKEEHQEKKKNSTQKSFSNLVLKLSKRRDKKREEIKERKSIWPNDKRGNKEKEKKI